MDGDAITRKPEGPYLIESSPYYAKRLELLKSPANQLLRQNESPAHHESHARTTLLLRITMLPVTTICAAVAGYRDELLHMIDAQAIYLGPGK